MYVLTAVRPKTVPEENRDLAGRNSCANFAFSRRVARFRKFCLGAQFLRRFGGKFATLWSAIFHKIRKFCNLRAICAKLRSILAHFQRNIGANSTNYTKNSVVLRLPYCIS